MNRNYGLFGLAKASASAPAVDFPASASSAGIDAAVNNEAVRVTNGARDTTVGRYITGTDSTASVTTLAFPIQVGMLLYGALGSDSVSRVGSTAYYTHDITMAQALPELNFFQQVGSSSAAMQKLAKAKVSSLNISAEGVTPPAITMEMTGTEATWLATTTWSGPGNAMDEWFTSAGATVLLALSGDEPGAVPAYIALNSFETTIDSPLTAMRKFGSVSASEVADGACTVSVSLSGTCSDTKVYRIVKTGTESGTDVSSTILTGALQVTFPHISDDDQSLVLKFPAIPWNCEALNVDVEGGPFDLTLSTDGAIAEDGTSIEVLLTNKQTTAYGA